MRLTAPRATTEMEQRYLAGAAANQVLDIAVFAPRVHPKMSFAVARDDDASVVDVGEQLVVGNRQELERLVLAEAERGVRRIRLDFARTEYVDSSGLGALVKLLKRLRERGTSLELSNLGGDLESIFRFTKLDRLFGGGEDAGGDPRAGRPAPLPPRKPDPLHGAEDWPRAEPDAT